MDSKTVDISPRRAFMYFAIFTILLYVTTRHIIPLLNGWGMHPAISWFISSGLLIFIPIFIIPLYNVRDELQNSNRSAIFRKLWLRKMEATDWLWALGGTVLILILTAVIMYAAGWISELLWDRPFTTSPPFMHFEPLEPHQYWILIVWAVFFFFNIVGEELMWRGYILSRMSEKYPQTAWIYNAVFWMMFHIPFGIELMIMVLPTFFLIPYLVQRRKNTWIGIIIHAGLNGPGFILVSLGIIQQ